jgi:hypothetical protein
MTTRFLYQPHDGQTVCGSLALPQRGQSLRDGLPSFHAPERRLRDFDFDFFFLGTATVISGLRDGHGYKQPNEVTGNAPNAAKPHPRIYSWSRKASSADQRSSLATPPQAHGSTFKSAPQVPHNPAQSSRHNDASGNSRCTVSRTRSARSI